MKLERYNPEDWASSTPTLLQRFARFVFSVPGRWLLRFKGYGPQFRVPADGGFLLAPGPHGAFRDPLVFGLGQQRTRLRFMVAEKVMRLPVVGRIVRWGGGFPVIRGNGRSEDALTVARTIVNSGDGVCVFAEGKLVLDGPGLGEPRSGLARLALSTGIPVVPVAGYGTKRRSAYGRPWWRGPHPVTICWGEPLNFPLEENPTPERVAEVRDLIWEQVARLYDVAHHIATSSGRRPKANTVNVPSLMRELEHAAPEKPSAFNSV